MQNAAVFWDNVAVKYAKSTISDMDAYTRTLERTRSYLTPTDNILEIGCGTGSTAMLLAKDVRHITASDLSGAMTRIGTEKAKDQGISNIKLVTADLYDNALETELYDGILAFNLLHLLQNQPAVLKRIASLLKPGGLFISKTVCKSDAPTPLKFKIMMMILPLMQWFGKAPYVNIIEIGEFEKIITTAGFKIIETGNYPASPPSRYIVARKV